MLHALQVGSKNAAFFMGKCIKIATRSTGSDFVHELGIAAADLEERYKAHGASITSSHCKCIMKKKQSRPHTMFSCSCGLESIHRPLMA